MAVSISRQQKNVAGPDANPSSPPQKEESGSAAETVEADSFERSSKTQHTGAQTQEKTSGVQSWTLNTAARFGHARELRAPARSARSQKTAQAPKISDAEFDKATRDADSFAEALRRRTPAQRNALIQRLVREDPERLNRILNQGKQGAVRNERNRTTIAKAFHDARASGAITGQDVKSFVDRAGGHATRGLVNILSHDSRNSAVGGLLEEVGQAARAQSSNNKDYQLAADLALSSSQELVDKHFSDPAERRQAFERIDKTLREDPRYGGVRPNGRPSVASESDAYPTNQRVHATGSWLRLAPPETSDERIRTQINSLGDEQNQLPSVLDRPGDRKAGNSPMERLIAATKGRPENEVLWAQAVSSTPELLKKHAPDKKTLHSVFDILARDLEAQQERIDSARGQGTTALRHKGVLEGITNIFEHRGSDLLGHVLESPASRDAMLPQIEEALSRTLFSPNTSKAQKNRIMNGVEKYIQDATDNVGTDAPVVGKRLGHLLGAIHNSADLALNRSHHRSVRNNISNFLGRAAGKIAGELSKKVYLKVFVDPGVNTGLRPEIDAQKEAEKAEARFKRELQDSGGDVKKGVLLRDSLTEGLARLQVQLNNKIVKDSAKGKDTEETKRMLTYLMQLQTSIVDGYTAARQRRLRAS